MGKLIDGVEVIKKINETNILNLKNIGILIIFIFVFCMTLGVVLGLIIEDVGFGIEAGGGTAILLILGLMVFSGLEFTLQPKIEKPRYEIKLTNEINMEEFTLKYKIIKQTKEGTYIVEEIE